jgi:membrane-associated phospholipid phosphatase
MTPYRNLLTRSVLSLLACAGLVAFCYFFIDIPVAFFVHDHRLNQHVFLKWMAELAMVFNALAPIILVVAAIRLAWGPLARLELTLVASSLSLIIAVALEYYLKPLFGRYWPETWIHNNPSLIKDFVYGFHPFHFAEAYKSFPSGHTARAFAFMSVIWIVYPWWRWLCVLLCATVIVGLIGMNYHFVGDIVGGAFLGSVTGAYLATGFSLGSGPKGQELPEEQPTNDHGRRDSVETGKAPSSFTAFPTH